MNIISREFLHNNLSITVEYSNKGIVTHNRAIINEYIDRAKTYLVNEHQVKSGEKILLDFDEWPDFLVWFIASAELGLILTVLDPASKSISNILSIYQGIDHVISHEQGINPGSFYSYYNTDKKQLISATPNSILVYTTSSGSTNTPKLVTYTHEFLYKLSKRNQKIYNLLDTDKSLHVHTLIHSSVVGIYFLPVLHSCAEHFYFQGADKNWVNFVQTQQINRCAVFHKYLDLLDTEFDFNINYKFNIIAISRLPASLKQKLNNNVKVLSAFGCSEASGPVLLSVIDSSTNDSNFGKPLDDFYNVYIDDDELVVEYDDKVIRTGDRFHIEDDDYIYKGRLDVYKINNSMVDISELARFVTDLYQTPADIVVDLKYNLLYLRIDIDINVELLNQHIVKQFGVNYQIATTLVKERSEFVNNVKFNANGVRLECRQKLSLEN